MLYCLRRRKWTQSVDCSSFLQLSLLVSSLVPFINCQYVHTPEQIKSFFEREEIIPDVLIYGPTKELKIQYGEEVCNFGTAFTATEVKNPPKLSWDPEPGAYYTLTMTDPDVPNRKSPVLREYQHWLVVNIPENRTQEGKTLTEYIGVIPEHTKVIHRYVFFVYKQPGKKPMKFDEPYKEKEPGPPEKRAKFHTEKFSKKYKLNNPIFGNYFLSGPVIVPSEDDNLDPEYRKIGAKIDFEEDDDDDDDKYRIRINATKPPIIPGNYRR